MCWYYMEKIHVGHSQVKELMIKILFLNSDGSPWPLGQEEKQPRILGKARRKALGIGFITSRCTGNEPALLPKTVLAMRTALKRSEKRPIRCLVQKTKIFLVLGCLKARNRTIARWRHFTTTTRILEFVVFLCKLRLLFFNPQWDWEI